ncbi:DNA polymerase IV [Paenibacillus sp. IITD108]|uniref:DNA polymerase IV n=1 Tax=Paenibacillus sp. IITD108 TaxID=3116649 RepID=UPI002F4087A8
MAANRIIMLADCQSFYASVEKAERPEQKHLPLVVAGDPERRSGIILAACPVAKKYGVTTAERLGDSLAKCPELIVAKPRMQLYIDVSLMITTIYQSFTDIVEPYSIDEQFLDVTSTLHLYGTAEQLAQTIQARVLAETGIYTRFGIASNKILAKMACDNFAKKNSSGIYTMGSRQMKEELWKLPIARMFMVGSRMNRHLNMMGLETIGDLASTPLEQLKQMMRRKFGRDSDINAELYWRIANGIDDSPVTTTLAQTVPKSIGHMMTLPQDYSSASEIKIVLLELTELVAQRCRSKGYVGYVVSVSCMGADYERPRGFHRQMKMLDPTNITNRIYDTAVKLLMKHWNGLPVRKVGVSLSGLCADDEYQLSLFDLNREKMMALEKATDAIKSKYGDSSIFRAVSITQPGQALLRSKLIGGHFK